MLPPNIEDFKTETRQSVKDLSLEEQYNNLHWTFTRLLDEEQHAEENLWGLYCIFIEDGVYKARYNLEKEWIQSVPGLEARLQRCSRRVKETIRLSKRVFKKWDIWPWDLITADQQPRTWSRGLLQALQKLTGVTSDASSVKTELNVAIRNRSNRSYLDRHPRVARHMALVLQDVKDVSVIFIERNKEAQSGLEGHAKALKRCADILAADDDGANSGQLSSPPPTPPGMGALFPYT